MKNKYGFTLVELLVVIAIIGILSSVAIVNLNSARKKARAASAQAALVQITPAAILCMDEGQALTTTGATVCAGVNAPVVGGNVCSGSSAVWPALPTGWIYATGGCASSPSSNPPTWSFVACETACSIGNKMVACSNTGCAIWTL